MSMTPTHFRSLDVLLSRRLHIAAFSFFLLLLTQTHSSAQTIDCPLCPTNGARDTLPPHIKCYVGMTSYLDSTGFAHISPLTPLSLLGDNCPVLTVWANQTRYYCRDIGVKSMIIFAQDSAGNIAQCTTRITVVDTIRAKAVNCPKDTTLRLASGACTSQNFNFTTPSVSDNCAASTPMSQKSGLPSGSSFPSGISTVVFEATDAGGLKTTCSFKITVSPPVGSLGSPTCVTSLDVNLTETCQASLVARDILTGTNLHCLSDYQLALSFNATPIANNTITGAYIGKTIKAQITDNQTNTTCTANVNIKDAIAPRIAAPNDTLVACNATNALGATPISATGTATVLAECSTTTTTFSDAIFNTPTCNGSFATAPTGFPTTLRFDAVKGQQANRLVVRTFKVTDASSNSAQIQQVIYVKKTDLTLVACPANITVQCSGNGVNTTPDSALISNVLVRGTGRPTFANGAAISGGGCSISTTFSDTRLNNATGYALTRTWIITNACSNETRSCVQIVTILDNPPVIACKSALPVTLASGTGIATVTASSLVASLTDACTPLSNLMVRIQRMTNGMPWPDSTQVTFNCNDIGSSAVEVLVKDEAGLMAKCQTSVQVSDPNRVCRAPSQPVIIGRVETEEGREIVSNVLLKSDINTTIWQFTRSANFNFNGIPRGDDCALTPSRDSDLLNGVTTLDVALMSRHILDVQPIKSALKQIAGDVNADGSIDALDMVITRRMVLRLLNAFPNNKSWRFVPKVFQFTATATTVPTLNYPEFLQFVNLTDTVRAADFWAVKIADLNGTATGPAVRANPQVDVRGGRNALILNVQNEFLEKDKTYDIAVSSDKMDADGFQFTLNYDNRALKILSIEQGELSDFSTANYALFPSEGKVTVSWNGSPDGKASPMNIFRLRLTAKQSVQLSDVLRLTSDLTPAEAFSLAGDTRSVQLVVKGAPSNDFNLCQNDPNPTTNGTTNIRFRLPEASEARLTLYDLSGKIWGIETRSCEKGDNTWRINTPSVSGVLLYRLDTPSHSATRRMVVGN